MDKLSERLWIMRVSLPDLEESELATLDEAIKQIERYEDAPVVELTECNQIQGATDYDWGDMQAAIAPMKPGQRVRILLDTEGA